MRRVFVAVGISLAQNASGTWPSCVTVLERVGHRLFVLAILLHESQVKKQGGLLNQLEC
jgi:hypothetical protein